MLCMDAFLYALPCRFGKHGTVSQSKQAQKSGSAGAEPLSMILYAYRNQARM